MCIENVKVSLWEYKDNMECVNPLIPENILYDMVNYTCPKEIDGRILCVDDISKTFMRKHPNLNIVFYDNETNDVEERYREKRWANVKYYGRDYYMLTYCDEYEDQYVKSKRECKFVWNRDCNVVYQVNNMEGEDIKLYLTEFTEKPKIVGTEEWNKLVEERVK